MLQLNRPLLTTESLVSIILFAFVLLSVPIGLFAGGFNYTVLIEDEYPPNPTISIKQAQTGLTKLQKAGLLQQTECSERPSGNQHIVYQHPPTGTTVVFIASAQYDYWIIGFQNADHTARMELISSETIVHTEYRDPMILAIQSAILAR